MKAVSNTTPLRCLIAIEQEHLFGKLFEKVFVPVAVHDELTDARTPEIVRRCMASLPSWFEVCTVDETLPVIFPVTLHRGERQAILVTEAIQADVLLIDEQIGRTIALSRNVSLSGTLGVLERADTMGVRERLPAGSATTKGKWFFLSPRLWNNNS
jgi:predicted nucleic acid-binding protein